MLVATHGAWLARALLTVRPAVDADFWLAMPMPAVFTLRWDAGGVPVEVVGPGLDRVRGST